MKRFALFSVSLLLSLLVSAQEVDDVTLVVSGEGATKEDATHVALRSAIEQAYGVFVSANTEILNDELVKDEIATVTSGNIKSFKELSATTLPNGIQMVTLQAVVSTKKLAAFAQSKGASCEFAGATFGANLKLIKLNQENTQKAFDNMLVQLKTLVPNLFDKQLEATPTADGKVTFKIKYYTTETTRTFCDIIYSTCKALAMSDEDIENMNNLRVKFEDVYYKFYKYTKFRPESTYPEVIGWCDQCAEDEHFWLYSAFPYKQIDYLINLAMFAYKMQDNLDNEYYIYLPGAYLEYHNISKSRQERKEIFKNYKYYLGLPNDAGRDLLRTSGNERYYILPDLRPYEVPKSLFSSKTKVVTPEVGQKMAVCEFRYFIGVDNLTKISKFDLVEIDNYVDVMKKIFVEDFGYSKDGLKYNLFPVDCNVEPF